MELNKDDPKIKAEMDALRGGYMRAIMNPPAVDALRWQGAVEQITDSYRRLVEAASAALSVDAAEARKLLVPEVRQIIGQAERQIETPLGKDALQRLEKALGSEAVGKSGGVRLA